jgi:hypothetical protein
MIFGRPILFADDCPKEITELAVLYHNKFLIKYKDLDLGAAVSIPPQEKEPQTEAIALDSIGIEDSRTFSGKYLCTTKTKTICLRKPSRPIKEVHDSMKQQIPNQ